MGPPAEAKSTKVWSVRNNVESVLYNWCDARLDATGLRHTSASQLRKWITGLH